MAALVRRAGARLESCEGDTCGLSTARCRWVGGRRGKPSSSSEARKGQGEEGPHDGHYDEEASRSSDLRSTRRESNSKQSRPEKRSTTRRRRNRKLDVTSLSSLKAGKVAATRHSQLLAERRFDGHSKRARRRYPPHMRSSSGWIPVVRSIAGVPRLSACACARSQKKLTRILTNHQEGLGRQRPVGLRRDHRRRHRQPVQRLRHELHQLLVP